MILIFLVFRHPRADLFVLGRNHAGLVDLAVIYMCTGCFRICMIFRGVRSRLTGIVVKHDQMGRNVQRTISRMSDKCGPIDNGGDRVN